MVCFIGRCLRFEDDLDGQDNGQLGGKLYGTINCLELSLKSSYFNCLKIILKKKLIYSINL